MINEIFTKAAAVELFEREAVLLGECDGIPFYRAVELFGEEAASFLDKNVRLDGYMKGGTDWNGIGACSDERPLIQYLYKAGFLKVVTEHNYLRTVKSYKESEARHILERYSEERSHRIDEQDAEEERKKAERRAKRVAEKARKGTGGAK